MTRLFSCLDRCTVLEYFVGCGLLSDKNIDKLLRFVYNQCRKCAIIGVRHE